MKYKIKDYPEFYSVVKELSDEELILFVMCPCIYNDDVRQDTGSVFMMTSTDEVLRKRIDCIKKGRKFPVMIATDVESGVGFLEHGTKFPSMMACGEANDEQLAYEMGRISAIEAGNLGFQWGLGPCIDILGNVNNPIVGNRTSGSNPDRIIKIAKAVVAGMQDNGLVAAVKHFPGDGYCAYDQHLTTPVNPLSENEWRATYGRIYKELIDAGVKSIMIGHISLPSMDDIDPKTGAYRPATLSKRLMTDLLKNDLGFEGIVISDAANMGGFCGYMNIYRAYAEFLEAGGDVILFATIDAYGLSEMKELVANGVLKRETLENRAYRLLCFAKEHERELEVVSFDPAEHECVAEQIAKQGMVIERDRYCLLPFAKKTGLKILYNLISYNGKQQLDEDILEHLKDHAELLDVISDVGPGEIRKKVIQGNYDLIVCRVNPMFGYGTNTSRLSGVLARNMMLGWQKLGTPVVFITESNSLAAEYEVVIDTLINTHGYEKNGYPRRFGEYIVNMIFEN